tara:strand:- start:627 stop:1712 length:1086 start_codon:yes stop_codon:yes gene_type:complete
MGINKNLYNKIVANENIYNKEIGYKLGVEKKSKMIFFSLLLCVMSAVVKVFWSNNQKNKTRNKKIGISWNQLHSKKIALAESSLTIVNIDTAKLLQTSNLKFLKGINLFYALRFALEFNEKLTAFSYQSFFYRIYLSSVYDIIDQILTDIDNVFISGHFDRFVSIISDISEKKEVELNLVQHGCIQIFKEQLIKNKVTGNIYYLNDFSVPYFQTFLDFPKKTKFVKLESKKPEINFIQKSNKKIIVFGCQDAKPENNLLIINHLINHFPNKLIYIIPHPREDIVYYTKRYKLYENSHISREKPLNVEFFVSRFSTLGIEYASIGIRSLFINIDNVKMDFIISGKYEVYNSLNQFKKNLIEK